MSTTTQNAVERVFPDVLRTAAYSFGEACDKTELTYPEAGLFGRIQFSGHSTGKVFMAAPKALAAELAANALGLDAGDPEASVHAEDAYRELLNMVCGNLLTTWSGAEPVFDLCPPEVEPLNQKTWQELISNPDTQAFLVDSTHPVALLFTVSR